MNDENEYPGVSIILYDRTGEIVQYDNIDTISTNVPDGKDKAVFSYGTVLEDVQVPLNFSEGNQLVKVQYGQLVREATILRPENFIPENIKKGEEIAGLIGTFAGDETEKIVDLDFRDYIYINDEESMLTLLNEENNIGLCIKYIGEDGRYENGKYYQIVESYDNFSAESCFESTAETNADTTLTSEIECYIGDLIIAAFVTRSNLVSIGDNNWTIISFSESTLEHDNTCSVDQRLYFAYKFAESTTETITVTQESEDAIYINMVSFSDGIDFIDTGYQYASGGSSATFDRPTNEIILWGITKSLWSTSNPVWSVSNDSKLIQLGDTTASILLLAVDNSKDATVKFTSGVSTTPDVYICGTLSIILKPFVFKEISEDKLTISDKQIVNADEGTVLTKVTINKPEGLESNNIRKGVTIGEIDGGIDVQKLNAPTITATASGVYNNLTIVNPSTNGNFADTLNYYINGELITVESAPAQAGTTTKKDLDLYNGINGTQTIGVSLSGAGFDDSEMVTVQVTMYGINITPTVDDGYDYPAIRSGATYSGVISNKGTADYFPIKPIIKMGGVEITNYTWNRDIGIGYSSSIDSSVACATRCQNATLQIPNVTDILDINIPYTEKPVLDNPTITNNNGIITVTAPKYAESVVVYCDGEEYLTIQGLTYSLSEAEGYYKFSEKHGVFYDTYLGAQSAAMYRLGRLLLVATEETTLVLRCSYEISNTNNKNNYLLLSKLDTALSASTSVDATANLQQSFYGLSSGTQLRTITYTVPAGEHFIDIKYRTVALNSSLEMWGAALYQLCNAKSFNLKDYDSHTISAIAKATCSDSIDSEEISVICQMLPICSVSNRILTASNLIDSIKQIEIYIDDTLVDIIDYDNTVEFSVDLTNYPYHDSSHLVSIKVIGDDFSVCSDTVTANLTIPAPTLSLNDRTLIATNIVSQVNEIELYINDVLYNTYDYIAEDTFSIDLSDLLPEQQEIVPTWAVETVSGATYGFTLNSNNYYVSGNTGINNSYALCKVVINNGADIETYSIYIKVKNTNCAIDKNSSTVQYGTPSNITATFNCINYAESNYDFGILSTLDKTLTSSYTPDTSNVAKSFKGASSTAVQTVAYTVPFGEHFVYVKYRKDGSQHSGNDSLQFTVVLS